MICENAASEVRDDLESFFSRLIPDGDPLFSHIDEGADDMPAHIRSVLTQTELSIPVIAGRLALGTWQGVYLWEHRTSPHLRDISMTIHGLGA
jgi:secondary thiamine-phosphate synthase enzyme